MNTRCQLPPSNPFATRFVRPGAISYDFSNSIEVKSASQLIEILRQHRFRGAIVGPHGSGKSTLVETLLKSLADETKLAVQVHRITLHDGQRWLPRGWFQVMRRGGAVGKPAVLVIDGYEQLAWPVRWWLALVVRVQGWGVLVTAHAPINWPTIFTTRTSPDLAKRLARHLVSNSQLAAPSAETIAAAFAHAGGNQREVFFELYDWAEQHRQPPG
jgi:ABC-type cobalamin/Fe3+-siderophores transport system ATPase subunit